MGATVKAVILGSSSVVCIPFRSEGMSRQQDTAEVTLLALPQHLTIIFTFQLGKR